MLGDVSNLTGTAPTMTGTHLQAYTMNTLQFVPGSDIPGATGLVTGAYNYDQATQTTFYASCSGAANCTLAGNGQPYVGDYSGMVNPSRTSGVNWSLTVNPSAPAQPAPLVLNGAPPAGTVGVAYQSGAMTASGGVAPYRWTATGLPNGFGIDSGTGVIAGTPTTAGTYTPHVIVSDAAQTTSAADPTITINSAPIDCSGSNAVITGVNKFWLDLYGGLKNGGQSVVYTPTPAGTTFTGGATTFLVGELVDYAGTLDGIGMCDAVTMTVKPAISCTKPSGAKSVSAKAKITQVGPGFIVVGGVTLTVATCTKVSWNGAAGFAAGQVAEYKGYATTTSTVATSITIN